MSRRHIRFALLPRRYGKTMHWNTDPPSRWRVVGRKAKDGTGQFEAQYRNEFKVGSDGKEQWVVLSTHGNVNNAMRACGRHRQRTIGMFL